MYSQLVGKWDENVKIYSGSPQNVAIDYSKGNATNAWVSYLVPGNYEAYIHCIDTTSNTITSKYMLSIVCDNPLVTKSETIKCPVNKESTVTISYINPLSEVRRFTFVSSDKEVVDIENSEDEYAPQEEKQISLAIAACTDIRLVYIYVYDQIKKLASTIKLIINI
jgi:hypothetical protein